MARPLRLFVALLLSLLLPLSGMAGIAAPTQPCPEHEMGMAAMAGLDDSCCDEEKSARLGYKVCEAGQENCHAVVMLVVPTINTPVAPPGDALHATFQLSAPSSNADNFWRPPRL